MKIVPITQFGELAAGFRNIRSQLDGEEGVFDLVVEKVVPSHLVVEGATLLRLRFSWLLAVAVDYDIDVDMFGGLGKTWLGAPRLPGGNTIYPLLEITDSTWKSQLPEWRARDNPDVRHIRMIGAIASFDVLGELESGEWLENPHSEFPVR
jgi:hypothetical protein